MKCLQRFGVVVAGELRHGELITAYSREEAIGTAQMWYGHSASVTGGDYLGVEVQEVQPEEVAA